MKNIIPLLFVVFICSCKEYGLECKSYIKTDNLGVIKYVVDITNNSENDLFTFFPLSTIKKSKEGVVQNILGDAIGDEIIREFAEGQKVNENNIKSLKGQQIFRPLTKPIDNDQIISTKLISLVTPEWKVEINRLLQQVDSGYFPGIIFIKKNQTYSYVYEYQNNLPIGSYIINFDFFEWSKKRERYKQRIKELHRIKEVGGYYFTDVLKMQNKPVDFIVPN